LFGTNAAAAVAKRYAAEDWQGMARSVML
jgi:hypothetical protein